MVKILTREKFVKFKFCANFGSYFNVMPMRIVKSMGLILEEAPPGISATYVNGGSPKIEGRVRVIILTRNGQQKHLSFIAFHLPKIKEALLNAQTIIHIGILQKNHLNHDFPTGEEYERDEIEIIMGNS